MLRGHFRSLILPALAIVCLGCVNSPDRERNYRPRERRRQEAAPTEGTRPAATAQPPQAAATQDAAAWQPTGQAREGVVPTSATNPAPIKQTGADGGERANAAQTNAAAPPSNPASKLTDLHTHAARTYAGMNDYTARLRRREQINGKDRPEEVMVFKFRKQPFSVYLKFLGPVAKGREVVYVQGQNGGKIHTLAAAGDSMFVGAGQRVPPLAPDSMLVRSASRHPITEAGIGHLIERYGHIVASVQKGSGQYGTMTYSGPFKRSEYAVPLEAVIQEVPARSESALARGGKRYWFFEPSSGLPVLLITMDHTGHEVEYYCYDQVQAGAQLRDDDFNPDKLWGRK